MQKGYLPSEINHVHSPESSACEPSWRHRVLFRDEKGERRRKSCVNFGGEIDRAIGVISAIITTISSHLSSSLSLFFFFSEIREVRYVKVDFVFCTSDIQAAVFTTKVCFYLTNFRELNSEIFLRTVMSLAWRGENS